MLLPELVSHNARTTPEAALYIYASPPSDTVRITNLEFARATHRAAHVLRPRREGPDGEVVAVIALSDTLLYHAVVVGLIAAQLTPFPISPRNSAAAVIELLRKTSCHRIVATCVTLEPLITEIQEELRQTASDSSLTVVEMPSLERVFPNLGAETSNSDFHPYPSAPTPPLLDDITLYLHSSGSTGFPKAIPATHRIINQWGSFAPVTDLRDHFKSPLANMAVPAFHMGGWYGQLLQPIYGGMTVALFPPIAATPRDLPIMPTPVNVLEHARKTKCRFMCTFPAFLIAWSKSPDAIAYLKSLDLIAFSGGSVPPRIGDLLVNSGVNLRACYAGTEFGAISKFFPRPGDEADWAWIEFSDRIKLRWEPQGDGTSECQLLTWEHHNVCVENLPDMPGYGTSDLFVNHPEKKHLWKIVGRVDDVIVHASAEKTVPAPMEGVVTSSPLVAGAIMFGRERDQAGILIEPVPASAIDVTDASQVAELRNKIWPIIEDANEIAPDFSRIFKEMILFTSPEKPLPRAAKGTVLRKAALNVYGSEIGALYDVVAEKTTVADYTKCPATWVAAAISAWLCETARDLSKSDRISPEMDLFQRGFDSLSATFLRIRILAALRSSMDPAVRGAAGGVTQNTIYAYPTVAQLSAFLVGLIAGTPVDSLLDPKTATKEMLLKYSADMPASNGLDDAAPAVGGPIVLLTGSSGSLGSHILARLLKDDSVVKIYAFNRTSLKGGLTSAERHRAAFEDKGLETMLLSSEKLVFLEGRTDEPDLGLPVQILTEIRNSVTVIIHNAWMLDLNKALSSFEPLIRGLRHLMDFALTSPRVPRFVFTSSVSAVLSWDQTRGACPEQLLDLEMGVGASTGYGQSKFVAEQLIAKSGLRASIVRIGQVCGAPSRGAWAATDWFPILVKTSLTLGHLPLADGLISWIDFNAASQGVLDVAFSTDTSPSCRIFNLVHPRPVPWNTVMHSLHSQVQKYPKTDIAATQLSNFQDWFAGLEAAAQHASDADGELSGIKLLETFRQFASATGQADSEVGMFSFATEKMCDVSPAVREAPSIGDAHVAAWVDYWGSAGFI
ncbi:putative aminoadipate reductase [Mycena belliarum]|uniref:Aminoadipate reductase n=1 Tax=Mycena belliarum TaxID=1033014 RepID=A0AAD6U3H6_9AGAR|nr:putative aminoadipate reductase [Mycena belliae]